MQNRLPTESAMVAQIINAGFVKKKKSRLSFSARFVLKSTVAFVVAWSKPGFLYILKACKRCCHKTTANNNNSEIRHTHTLTWELSPLTSWVPFLITAQLKAFFFQNTKWFTVSRTPFFCGRKYGKFFFWSGQGKPRTSRVFLGSGSYYLRTVPPPCSLHTSLSSGISSTSCPCRQ